MPPEEVLVTVDNFLIAVSLVLGLLVGSFCNVCVGRWPHGESVVSPRSRCPKCMGPIVWYDNIPLLSWLILGAKCRNCKAPISWQYPLVEAITGVLFVLVYLRFGMTIASPIYMLLAAAMVVVTFQDLADWTIPDEVVYPGIPLGLGLSVVALVMGDTSLVVTDPFDSLEGIVLGFSLLYGLDRLSVLILKKPGMGFGDVKLLAMLGAFIGWQGVLGTLMMASILGSTVGLSVMLYFHLKNGPVEENENEKPEAADPGTPTADAENVDNEPVTEETEIVAAKATTEDDEDDDGISLDHRYLPFGPYLAIGGLIYVLYGPQLVAWYLAQLAPTGF